MTATDVIRGGWIARRGWPSGPWDHEADLLRWRDAATGLDCVIIRHEEHGHLRGYVGVPAAHVLYGTDIDGLPCTVRDDEDVSFAMSSLPLDAIEHIGRRDDDDCKRLCTLWWFGFACAGTWDVQPGRRAREMARGYIPTAQDLLNQTYADLEYVKAECEKLAESIREFEAEL